MPTYEVELAHRTTGATSIITIEAINKQAAMQEAAADHPKHLVRRAGEPAPAAPATTEPPPPTFTPGKGMIICPNPNCGYKGPVKKKARGSRIVGVILILFLLVPGILYFLFFSGYRYYCPRCGFQIARDA